MNMFEFVPCSKNDVQICSMNDSVKSKEGLLGLMFIEARIQAFEFDYQ